MPLPVRENLSWEQVAQIEVNSPDLPGVSIEVGQTRYYPLGGSTAHILGYVAQVSERRADGDPVLELPGFAIGKLGVEKQYDLGLRGRAGARQVEVNAVGRVVRELARDEGETGQDLTVTLDAGLPAVRRAAAGERAQRVCRGARRPYRRGPGAGSTPTFDPNAFNRSLSAAQWRSWMNDPLRAAGQQGHRRAIRPRLHLQDRRGAGRAQVRPAANPPGLLSRASQPRHRHLPLLEEGGPRTLNMIEGIKNSCDVYF